MKLIESVADKLQIADMESRKAAVGQQKIDCEFPLRQDHIIAGSQYTNYSRIYFVVEV